MIELNRGERAEWRQFMSQGTGHKVMLLLEQLKPGITECPEPHNFGFRAGKEQGYNACLNELRELAFGEEETQIEENPGLTPTKKR